MIITVICYADQYSFTLLKKFLWHALIEAFGFFNS